MASSIIDLARLSYVPRWAIVPMERPQTVSDHCFRVALICVELVDGKGWSEGSVGLLVLQALIHDAEEIHTGDIPATAKYGRVQVAPSQPAPGVPPQYYFIVKVADVVEAVTWFKKYESSGARRASILASLMQTFEGLKHHPNFDPHVYKRAERIIELGEIE